MDIGKLSDDGDLFIKKHFFRIHTVQRSFVFPFIGNINGGAVFKTIDGRTGKKYRKIVEENEINNFVVSDISGNKCGVSYEINNIDKEFPTINNIEDGNSYNSPVYPIYEDNVGISSIDVKKYSNLTCR